MISSPSVFDWNNNHMVDEMVRDGLHSPGLCIIKQFDNQWMYACTHTGHILSCIKGTLSEGHQDEDLETSQWQLAVDTWM